MKRLLSIFYGLGFVIMMVSCNGGGMYSPKPTAFGPVSQLNVVLEKEAYNSPLWDTISYYFSAPYPILPQPEPQFDIRKLEVEKLYSTPLTKSLRTYLFLTNMSNENSEVRDVFKERFSSELDLSDKGYRIKIIDDFWAKGQLFIYIIGKNETALQRAIQEGHNSIINKINEFDNDLVSSAAYMEGRSKKLENMVSDRYDLEMKVPGKYLKAISNDTLTWLRFNQEKSISSILIVEREYKGRDQFDRDYIIDWTSDIIKENIEGPLNNSYMVLNDTDLPVLYETEGSSDFYSGKLRAIWEMENAFMGGALISKAIYKPGTQNIYLLIGFVYAPGETKREYMQRIEHVIDQVKVVE